MCLAQYLAKQAKLFVVFGLKDVKVGGAFSIFVFSGGQRWRMEKTCLLVWKTFLFLHINTEAVWG